MRSGGNRSRTATLFRNKAGVGNIFTITGLMSCALSLADRKIYGLFPKVLPLSDYEEEWLLLMYYLSACLLCSFVLTWSCTLTLVTKILMRAISNVHVDRIWLAGRRFLTPVIKCNVWWKRTFLPLATILALHHKHMKLVKPFTPHVIARSIS